MSSDVAAVTLSTTAKALLPLANLPPLGSNYFSFVGKAVRIRMYGRITTAATPGNLTLGLYWGSGADANGTLLASCAATALVANQTSLTWESEYIVRCRALGASGSLMVVGMASFNTAVIASTAQPIMIPASLPAPVTVDLTANNVLSPQALRSGSTAETMQIHEFAFEAMN